MSEATDFIADLDDELASAGESVTLTRDDASGSYSVPFLAFVRTQQFGRGFSQSGQMSFDTQMSVSVIYSPTPIIAAGWPNGAITYGGRDARIPRKPDTLLTSRGALTIQTAVGIYMGGTLVRIEATALGEQG